jgi:hypothetical protein
MGKDLPEDLRSCSWQDDRWHEPHEGVIGVQRDDDLLARTEEALPRRLMMCAMASALHKALLVGNRAPVVERMANRFRYFYSDRHKYVPGDLLIEVTTLHGGDHYKDSWDRGFGTYITDRWEWASTKEEWETMIAEGIKEEREFYNDPDLEIDVDERFGPRGVDHAWYVQYDSNPEAVCRWTNCSFVAVPTSYDILRELEHPAGIRTENGVMLTKDSLLGSLADSGFGLNIP